jgi:general stress protein 26
MTLSEIVGFMRLHRLAVEASVSDAGAPQAAVVGFVVDDEGGLFFDTLESTRKCANLRRDRRVAFVIGWDESGGRTLQLEGDADEPTGAALEEAKARYFAAFPDGVARQTWPGITYFRVRPRWLRFSDFSGPEPVIIELSEADLRRGRDQ